jgi:hypothetical protein
MKVLEAIWVLLGQHIKRVVLPSPEDVVRVKSLLTGLNWTEGRSDNRKCRKRLTKKTRVNINWVYNSIYDIIKFTKKIQYGIKRKISQKSKQHLTWCKFVWNILLHWTYAVVIGHFWINTIKGNKHRPLVFKHNVKSGFLPRGSNGKTILGSWEEKS